MFGAAIMLLSVTGLMAQNLTVSIPKTDSTQYRCYPVKANTSFSLEVKVTCNAYGPFSVSIDRDLSFATLGSWVTGDNNPITINNGQTVLKVFGTKP